MPDKTTAVNLPEHSSSEPVDSEPKMIKQFLQVEILKLSKSVNSEPRMVKQFLWVEVPKRRQEDNNSDSDESAPKTTRVMLALAALEADNAQNIPTPLTYAKAVGDPVWGEMWKDAIKAELTALAVNSTWKEVIPLKNANIVMSKWVFKPKMHTNGSLDKLKARVVARGFSQMHDINYEDTFAPTVKFDTLCVFLALVALKDLECHQVDVNNAFTESFLKKIIYMAPSPGVDVAPGRILHILCSLYGLKQAARD